MAKVLEIAISKNSKGEMKNVNNVKTFAGKGLEGDRHFKANNNKRSQITLIESENINYYNKISGTSIQLINFRRNIITKGIQLNPTGFPRMKGPAEMNMFDEICK